MASHESRLSYWWPWWRRLHGYLALARISNSPTVASNVLAGAALAGALAPNGNIALLAVAMVLFYTAGMFLNDLCDYAIDCRARPDRPLPSGAVTRAEASAATVGLFVGGLAMLWLLGPTPFLGGLVLVGLIVLYDIWHKSNPLSPLIMAGCRAMVYVIAFVVFAPQPTGALALAASVLGLYIVGLTALAKSEALPGAAKHWPAVALILPAVAFLAQRPSLAALPTALVFLGWVLYSLSFAYRKRGRSIGGAIGRLIAGVALCDALVLALARAWLGVALALVAFGLTLLFQRYIKGT
ncbi:MAG TPA: UbiA family prenyltransferase [Roseiflexaceae bacterium]|nr:UbiA family prenyltransferase [Roseiflexaceae bacterium]